MEGAVQASRDMCAACFRAIEEHLGIHSDGPPADAVLSQAAAAMTAPLFVTLKTARKELRGCIGTFEASALRTQLPRYARSAAFQDSRFSPLRAGELSGLVCTVSLLHTFEKNRAWNDWMIGTHGVRIQFTERGRNYGSTFLPKVAEEQRWDQRTTLQQLVRKSGYHDTSPAFIERLVVERYQHSEVTLAYSEYRPGATSRSEGRCTTS